MTWRGGKKSGSESTKPLAPGGQRHSSSSGADRQWKRQAGTQLIDRSFARKLKLAAYSLVSLVLIGWLIVKLLFVPRPTPLVSFTCVGFPFPMPPNALATEDTQLLTTLSDAHSNLRCNQVDDTWGSKAEFLAAVREQSAKLRGGGPGGNTAVFQISAHGAVDEQNEPCLILPVSDPLDSSTWVPVREVLLAIASTESLSSVNKLLLLDAGKIQQDWSLGIVYNSFPERLAEIVSELAIPHLAVINSTGLGQASCLMPEAGASAFGYFLAQGLRESARGRDYQVSLHELHRFLLEQVDGFARSHRSDSQQPMLLPPDAPDFPLVYVTGTTELVSAPLEFATRLDELDSRWQDFSQLAELSGFQSSPMDWAEAEQRLLRLEQLLLAGKSYQQQYSSNDAQLRSVLEKLKTHSQLAKADFSSLAIAQQFDRVDPQQQAAAIEKYDAWRQALRTPNAEQPIPLPTLPFRLASQTAWQSLLAIQPTANDLDAALQLVDGATDRAPLDFDEIHFLRVLRQDLDWLGPAASQLAQVLAVQQRAQQVVATREFRSHYWLELATRRTDVLLRDCWDKLFVGRDDALQAAQSLWTQLLADDAASPTFTSIAQLDELGAKAYRTRDVALAKLKHFSFWLALSDQSFASQSAVDRSRLWTTWRELAAQTHRLGQALNAVSERVSTVDQLADVRQHQERTEQLLDELGTAFADECRRLWVENANDQATLKQIGVALQVPLIPGNDVRIRNELRRRYFSRRFADTNLQSSGDEASAWGRAGQYLDRALELDPHPALAILDRRIMLGEETNGSLRDLTSESALDPSGQARQQSVQLQRLAVIGGEIRTRLRGMNADRTNLANQTQQALSRNELPIRARLGLSQADHLLRAAATLLQQRSWKSATDDPSVQLEQLDTQFFLFWQASRALDDFWGPTQTGAPEYFAQRTAQLLAAARRLMGAPTPHREALESLAADRAAAAAAWQPIDAGDLHFTAEEKLVRHQIDVHGDPSIPAGTIAVLLQQTEGEPIPLTLDGQREPQRRQPADVRQSQTLQYWIANDQRLETTALDSIALFRGHRRPVTFFVDAGANATISSYVRPDTPPARIRVSGDSRQAMQVIFVLDCSYSMRFKHKVENRIVSRMELATDALTEIVRQLDGSEYQIGLVLYGHRAGWMDNKIRLRDPQRDRGLHPGADVEVVIPVTPIMRPNLVTGRIEDTRQSFFAALEELTPYGETPLYYAIARAGESFHSGPAGTRNIVVITDGSDRQSPDAPVSAKRGLQDLQSLLADPERKIRIDMIGFRADPDVFDSEFDKTDWIKNEKPRWEGSPKSGLLGLTSATGGAFHDVTRPGQLAQALRDSLRVARFQVRPKSTPDGASDELDLSREWVAPSSQVHGDFIVEVVDQPAEPLPLKIVGGEAFDLTYNRSQQRLEHRRFDEELLGSGVQLPIGPSPEFFVGSHIPQRHGRDEVWFRFSVQNADPTQFSSRPQAAWAEFRPILANGTRAESVSYFAYDCEFEPGRPVPVLRFRIAGWPFEAERAEVNVWFSPTAPSVQDLPLDLTQPSQITTIPQVPLRVQSQRAEDGRLVIIVDEEHTASSKLYPLWMQVAPAPDGARRTFVNDARRVRHEFTFRDPAGVQQSKPRLQVTYQQDLKEHWIGTGPIEVELPHR